MEIVMRHNLLLALLLTCGLAQTARSQSVAPPQKPDSDQQSTDQAARADRAVREANRAVRRAAQAGPELQEQYRVAPVNPLRRPRTEKAAYLGLSTSSPPASLRHQLKLPEGTGLVVEFVQPKSPAQEAGIRQYDLLLRLNDQLLINAEQLAVLVRTFKPGEEVRLTLLREGERQTVQVTLAERELPLLSDLEVQFQARDPYGQSIPVSPNPAPRGWFGGGAIGGGGGIGGGGAGGGAMVPLVRPGEHTLTWLDGKRQITVSVGGDQKTVIVADAKTGKIMFRGPLEAMQEQESLPPETREALSRLKQFLEATSDKSDTTPGQPKPK
jgi:hypothetical protein